MNEKTPKGMRLHIGIFGKRNAGKSTLINVLSHQDVSIVDATPGTTTDIVSKAMELKPFGPVLLIDTAGLDDQGRLGSKRVEKTLTAIDRIDLAIVTCEKEWSNDLEDCVGEFKKRDVPIIIVLNKCDHYTYTDQLIENLKKITPHVVALSALTKAGLDKLHLAMIAAAPKAWFEDPPILADLIGPGDLVIMVVPIDLEAPKGRLILPQVQILREILDCDAKALVVKERELIDALSEVNRSPKLVITDSQAILKVAADIPDQIPVTGFSVLFARWKGDLEILLQGVGYLDHIKSGDRVLMLETCTHHPIEDDIGRVKIPRWVRQYAGQDITFEHFAGHDLPEDLSKYNLIIHCGSCMGNRQQMLSRIMRAKDCGVPITNYGLVIAKSLGVLKRMLSPFPMFEELID